MTDNIAVADDLIKRGMVASQADQVEEALSIFQQAAGLVPNSGLPHFLIGAELAQAGRMDEAEAAFATAVVLAPELDMARYQLGLIQFTSGRVPLALVTWEPLFQRPPENGLQRVVHGFAALTQDDFDAAKACFREAISLNRDNEALNRDLQMLLDRIDDQTQGPAHPEAGEQAVTPSAVSPEATEAAEEEPGLHVLLSNYQHHGPAH